MTTLDATRARDEFADTLNRAAYGKERVILTRRGRPLAAVVPIEDVCLLEQLDDRPDLADTRADLAEAMLLQQMLGSSAAFLPARGCGILLWAPEGGLLTAMPPFVGLEEERIRPLAFPVEGAALAPVVLQASPVILDELTGPERDTRQFQELGLSNLLAVPLATQREVKGICCAFDKEAGRSFNEEDATVLTIMARQMAAVLDVTRRGRDRGGRREAGRRIL